MFQGMQDARISAQGGAFERMDYAGLPFMLHERSCASTVPPTHRALRPVERNNATNEMTAQKRPPASPAPSATQGADHLTVAPHFATSSFPAPAASAARADVSVEDTDEGASAPASVSHTKAKRAPKVAVQLAQARRLDGGHANFVRMATMKGKSAFRFKSKSGCSSTNPKNRKWAARKLAQDSLPVAGLGADSTRESHLVRTIAQIGIAYLP
jgi:hypothetical protein